MPDHPLPTAGIEGKYGKAIEALHADTASLGGRVIRLEAREDSVLAEAKAAAGSAASVAAMGYLTDIARRAGYLEALSGQFRDLIDPTRLAPG